MTLVADRPISLETVVGFLFSTPLFDTLDPAQRAEVVRIMEVQKYTEGEEVFHEGDAGDAWYVVYEGEVRVMKDTASGATELARIGPGNCVGEMAILDGQPRSATVIATGPVTMFRFRRTRFEDLLDHGSLGAYRLIAAMARTLSQRHRQLTQQLSELTADSGSGSTSAVKKSARATASMYQISE